MRACCKPLLELKGDVLGEIAGGSWWLLGYNVGAGVDEGMGSSFSCQEATGCV